MNFLQTILILGLVGLITACGQKEKIVPGKIIFLGDSITAGYGLEPTQAYPSLIQIPRMEMVNLSVSGATTSDALATIQTYFSQGNQAQLTVLAIGANDILQGESPNQIQNQLRQIVKSCKSANSKILLCGVHIPFKPQKSDLFSSIAKQENIPLLPNMLKGVLGQYGMMQEDRAHPTIKGQRIIADQVAKALETNFEFPK